MLAVEGLVKRFGGFRAVNNVSFRVEQGEILGLIGPNGSGKSTIFNMLSGTLPPTSGSILFDGREIAGLAPHRIIVGGIGRTFQIPRPFHRLSIFENVALAGFYGQGRHSRSKAEAAAERALALLDALLVLCGTLAVLAISLARALCVRLNIPLSPRGADAGAASGGRVAAHGGGSGAWLLHSWRRSIRKWGAWLTQRAGTGQPRRLAGKR